MSSRPASPAGYETCRRPGPAARRGRRAEPPLTARCARGTCSSRNQPTAGNWVWPRELLQSVGLISAGYRGQLRVDRLVPDDDPPAVPPEQVAVGQVDQRGHPVAPAEQVDQVQSEPGEPGERAAYPQA